MFAKPSSVTLGRPAATPPEELRRGGIGSRWGMICAPDAMMMLCPR